MLNEAPSTASDFRDMLAQEVPIQFSGFGLNWRMDSTGKKRQVNPDSLSCPPKKNTHRSLHLQNWNKANFKVPEGQLYQGIYNDMSPDNMEQSHIFQRPQEISSQKDL